MHPHEPITASDVLDLVRAVEDPARTRAIVIVSACHRGERLYGLSPARVARAVGDRAQVWLLPSAAHNEQFADAWPAERRGDRATFGGALRVIGATDWTAVVRTDIRSEGEVISRIVRGLRERDVPPASPSVVVPSPPREAAATLRPPAGTVTPALRSETAPPANTPRPAEPALAPNFSRHAAALVACLRQALDAERQRSDELAERVAELEATSTPCPVYADPERQLRHEINLAWLGHLPEEQREQWPLRQYVIGPNLLPLDIDLAGHDRILAVIVDVLTRRAYTLPTRAVHPHLERRGGRPVVRSDGAAAYRASVKSRAHGAARLLWWELVDGRVELAQVGHHDDALRGARVAS